MSAVAANELDNGDRRLAAWEIASIVSSVVVLEWIASSVAGGSKLIVSIPIVLALAFMIFSHRLRQETLRDLGFRLDNFFRAVKSLLAPMLISTIVCFVLGFWFG